MNNYKEKYGDWALITGATAGIGRAFAEELAAAGMNLVLTARRQDVLDSLSKDLEKKYRIRTNCIACDLSEDDFLEKIKRDTSGLDIGMLINNAGFGTNNNLLDSNIEREVKMIKLNCIAPLILTRYFLPAMAEKDRGAVIFLSSIAANQPNPGGAVYAATKVFDLYLGEALACELRKSGIDVLTVLPGATATEFQKVSGYEINREKARTPEQVARTALKKLGKKWSVTDGFSNKIMTLAARRFPLPRKTIIHMARKWIEKNSPKK